MVVSFHSMNPILRLVFRAALTSPMIRELVLVLVVVLAMEKDRPVEVLAVDQVAVLALSRVSSFTSSSFRGIAVSQPAPNFRVSWRSKPSNLRTQVTG